MSPEDSTNPRQPTDSHSHVVLDGIPIPIHEVNFAGAIVWVNEAAAELFGLPKAELIGQPIWEFVADSDAQQHQSRNRVLEKTAGKRPPDQGLPVPFRDGSGKTQVFAIHDQLILDSDERIRRIRTSLTDLNTSIDLQSDLHALGSTWAGDIDKTENLFVLKKDCNGVITHANLNLRRELQNLGTTIVGKSDFDLFPRELAEKYRRDDERLLSSDEAPEFFQAVEPFQASPENPPRQIQVIKSVIKNASGKRVGIQIIFWYLDDSDDVRLSLTETMRRQKDSVWDFLRESSIGFYRCASNGDLDYVNEGFARILGYENPDELAAKNMGSDIYFNRADRTRNARDLKAKTVFHGRQIQFKSKDGAPVLVSVSARAVDEVRRVMFEGVVLSIDKERNQRNKAEQLARMQSARFLASDVAHELSNGLMACQGYIENALFQMENGDHELAASEINSVLSYISASTKFLQDVSAIESTNVTEIETFSIRDIVEDVVGSLHLNNVKVSLSGDDLSYTSSKVILHRVLTNLVQNAADASRQTAEWRKPTVSVKWYERVKKRRRILAPDQTVARDLQIAIIDNGPGIENDKLKLIWGRGHTDKTGHTGLGLYLTRMFVESLLGGTISLVNNNRHGCKATVSLRSL